MKHILFITFAAIFTFNLNAQDQPVQWSTEVKQISDQEYLLTTMALIEPGWHINSQASNGDEIGPVATTLSFYDVEDQIELIGVNQETGSYSTYSDIWGFNVYQFDDVAIFEQRIKVLDPSLKHIIGRVFFQVCDDERCLRPAGTTLVYQLDPSATIPEDTDAVVETYLDQDLSPLVAQAPSEKEIPAKDAAVKKTPEVTPEKVKTEAPDEVQTATSSTEKRSLWSVFILAFLAGMAALLTPCVFPMIPLTVSFFTKQSKNRAKGVSNAILYGVFIIVIYVLLGTVVTAVFGDRILNSMATNPWVNLSFFIILVIFAISFLGAFEITLPQSWANRVDANANKGGIIGIFFMALALAIVSFSCTGPIVGSLILESSTKGGIAPIVGMFGFSLALALPFTLFAIFPGWMNSLPKSGGWLNTVKVVLGFLELALAMKFLSSADLVYQLHIIEREIFLALWIAVFGGLALYLFGKIKLPHDGPEPTISVGRLMLGLVVLSFTLYMVPGLWGAPLKIISGFPPPLNYAESPYGVGYTKIEREEALPEGAYLAVHDIVSFHDYETGLAYAQKVGKPVLLDFTGWACVNCRKMEERIWSDPKILSILKNEVVLISLYVDDAHKLPEDEQYESDIIEGKVRTVGDKWYELQKKEYNNAAQPYYALLDQNGNKIGTPIGYTPDVEEYLEWLQQSAE